MFIFHTHSYICKRIITLSTESKQEINYLFVYREIYGKNSISLVGGLSLSKIWGLSGKSGVGFKF